MLEEPVGDGTDDADGGPDGGGDGGCEITGAFVFVTFELSVMVEFE